MKNLQTILNDENVDATIHLIHAYQMMMECELSDIEENDAIYYYNPGSTIDESDKTTHFMKIRFSDGDDEGCVSIYDTNSENVLFFYVNSEAERLTEEQKEVIMNLFMFLSEENIDEGEYSFNGDDPEPSKSANAENENDEHRPFGEILH